MTIQILSNVGPARIDIAYERLGDPANPPVLLIMGIGAQMIAWPDGLCEALVAQGLHVIRFDNRDVGQSTHFSDAPIANLPAALGGDLSSASYTLSDMAADTAGLLDALEFDSVHVVGASMGGFIAQTLAIEHPTRVRSLTSIMSNTGALSSGQPRPEALRIFTLPPATSRAEAMQRMVEAFRIIGSPGFATDFDALAERAGVAYDRGHDPRGIARQAIAVLASGDRTAGLQKLDVPTLVIHGAEDVMCDVTGARATAAAIPNAELLIIEGMGHDLPQPLWADFATRIGNLTRTR